MPQGPVRSRRSAREHEGRDDGESGATVVVGEGQVARLLRDALDGDGVERPPGPREDPEAQWMLGARTVVLVVPAGEFGLRPPRGERGEAARRARLVAQARWTGRAAARHGVARVVVVTSAMVHGARAGRPVIDDGEAPAPDVSGFVGDLVAVEDELRAAVEDVPLTLLRPAVVVGPGVDTIVTRHFEAPRLLTVRDSERTWQLVHTDDLAGAVRVACEQELSGALTVGALRDGAPDVLDPQDVATLAGMRTVSLPEVTALGAAERLHRVGVLPSPASDLAFVVHPWTVSARRLHDAGWSPAWSSDACLEVLLAQVRGRVAVAGRRVGGRDAAALGAAGAAVALLGTAAVWRQARGRR